MKETLPKKQDRYFEAVGRRKEAVARVRLFTGGKASFVVNGVDYKKYFPLLRYQAIAAAPLSKVTLTTQVAVEAKLMGGGVSAQAEALSLGISRALLKVSPETRTILKSLGFLTRDARAVERKKYGLKKARRAPQWSKR
ncbi:MAG: 30S ribosomal protein S9 [Candidatus Colwellbacteria bacterium RIFCSPHIGHO2_12_FULL_44_17]|uniref:Small ribosomal subunit protein uS9 n=2 Tax=Candidatus Colwelliibacteriota TaxID=1817904 RepID=A0A1G1Z6H6_9BACT|nr:MAG: 30S ribosomal protein S9 [Candidatus Colwellbacteria bacterium RIFCSPHIGHO2_12_FULL_44_17]OGY60114.1 MAG: 30S ribosomal protein S9 [Candidatus Colwellbacteria bacterium RIFCSPLOWO2_02_FULL_44_20b]